MKCASLVSEEHCTNRPKVAHITPTGCQRVEGWDKFPGHANLREAIGVSRDERDVTWIWG